MNNIESTKIEESKEQKEKIAKEYGLNLEQIKHIKLNEGKEFFEFVDPKTKTVKMVENIDYNRDLKTQFQESQNNLSSSQSEDAKENAENTFKHNLKYKNKETELISIEEFKTNKYHYIRQVRELETIKKNKIIALLHKQKELKLEYINLENGIGIDEEQNVIDVKYDFISNKAEFVNPLTISYNNTLQEGNDMDVDDVDLSTINLDDVLNQLNIVDDINVTEEKQVEVSGVTIDSKTVAQVYEMPEILDKDTNMNKKQRTVYRALLDKMKNRFSKGKNKKNGKQLVYKNNNNNKAA